MDRLTSIRIKYSDGTYLDEVPIGVLAQNVGYDSGHNLIQVLGSVDVDSDGTIQQQINRLFNEKLNSSDLSGYVNSKITTDVSTWLANNVNPVGSAVVVDSSLTVSGAAADAKKTGDEIADLKSAFENQIADITEFHKSKNLIDKSKAEIGYLNSSTGAVSSSDTSYKTTDYIDISAYTGKLLTQTRGNPPVKTAPNSYVFCDATKTRIAGGTWTNDIVVPSGAVFVRICLSAGYMNASPMLIVTDDGIVTEYYEYFEPYYTIKNSALDLDNTLTERGKPADAKATGDAIAELNGSLENVTDKIRLVAPDNWHNTETDTIGFVLNADGTTTENANRFYTDFIPVKAGDVVRHYLRSTHNTPYRYAVTCYDNNKTVMASAGNNSTSSYGFTVPDGVAYVRITFNESVRSQVIITINLVPTDWTIRYFDPYQVFTEDFVTEETGAFLSELEGIMYAKRAFGTWEVGSYNYSNGANYETAHRIRLTDFIEVDNGFISVKANSGYEFSVFAWDKETGLYVGALMTTGRIDQTGTMLWITEYRLDDAYKYKVVLRDSTDQSRSLDVSESDNCIFVVSRFKTDPTLTEKNWSADAEAVGRRFNQIEFEIAQKLEIAQKSGRMITHETPNSIGELNVVKRARQLTDIKWTPAVDIPRISQLANRSGGANSSFFEDVFKAGVEYTGIPYGQATKGATNWGVDATKGFKVGWGVGLDTFISAVSNPESVVSKESEYVWSGSTHLASYYSTICTALCGYALALPIYYTSSNIGNAPGMTDLGKVKNIDLEDLHLGDMLWNVSHGAIITDKLRDSSRNIIAIEISEATTIGNDDWNVQGSQYGGICRRRMWAVADFAKWREYNVYRYNNVDNTPYTPSPYVNVGDGGEYMRVVNFPVVPYMGENFEYVKGHIGNTKILTPAYREGYTNKLRVKKDGKNWNINGTTDYYDVSGAYVEVGFTDVGTYEAYLCQVENGTEIIQTRAAHWSVTE